MGRLVDPDRLAHDLALTEAALAQLPGDENHRVVATDRVLLGGEIAAFRGL